MKKPTWRIALATFAVVSTAFSAQPKLYCTAAKKEVETCCCEMKAGKSFCTLTQKTFDKCCCVTK
ncbi:MAG: hypothetical protein ABR526_03980 [Chthoniobacterales bacterium]